MINKAFEMEACPVETRKEGRKKGREGRKEED